MAEADAPSGNQAPGPADGGDSVGGEAGEPAPGAPAGEPQDTNGGVLNIETELTRDLGLVSALAIGVGTMIAAGIFTLSGLAVSAVGSGAIVSFLMAAFVALFTALTYCEFSSIYPQSGEGYLYARKTFAPPLAYMVGWCLLLGYTSSCGFYLASFSSYFNEFLWQALEHSRFEMASGLLALIALTLLNIKGTKESGSFQVVVTIGKVILLLWFVAGGISSIDAATIEEKFVPDLLKLGSTAALVFITFFGFSAIAASAGEVKDPTKTIPRAIFISMAIVTVLYTLVVLVIIGAALTSYDEAAMGVAAKKFLGPIGGMVIVGGALFSMVSASNASILAGSRVALSMSQLGHLPKELGAINQRTRTPVMSLLLVGAGIGAFALLLPLEMLAHFADCVLLVALILVNVALVKHRGMYPDIERPFRVPLVPLLPILGAVANGYLIAQLIVQEHYAAVILASAALSLGFLGFLAWKGAQVEEVGVPGAPSRVALERRAGREGAFRILVPIANPANVAQLIDVAAGIAKPQDGEIVALRVVVLPEQLTPSIEDTYVERERQVLETARLQARKHEVPITTIVRVGHDAARAILETSRERHCSLVILGWKGFTSTARRILGEVTDTVVTHARANIMLVKLTADGRPLKKILLPTAGGQHAKVAEGYASSLAQVHQGSLTLCSVLAPNAPDDRAQSETERLKRAEERIEGVETRSTVIRHVSVEEGILAESEGHDAIVVGAAGQSFSSQIMFGSIPESIARHAKCTVIVVKQHDPVKALVGRVMSE